MSTIVTDRDVNPDQLAAKVAPAAICVDGPYPDDHHDPDLAGKWVIRVDDLTAKDLAAVIDAHVADDDWFDPDPARITEPLDRLGVAYTYDVVIGFRKLADAAAALCLPEQALVDEATAWSLG